MIEEGNGRKSNMSYLQKPLPLPLFHTEMMVTMTPRGLRYYTEL
jgi:hypothetical protein